MARRRVEIFSFQPEPDPRPVGGLLFADPSRASMTRDVHTFNEPHSPRAHGEQQGFRSLTGPLVPWHDRTGAVTTTDAFKSMNRKRGVVDAEEDEY